MTKEMQIYLEVTRECLEQCMGMLETEKSKRKALLRRDTKELESVISGQQAKIMQLENMERKRLEAQAHAGFGGQTASQMLDAMPEGEEKTQLQQLLAQLRETVQQLKTNNQEALKIAQAELRVYQQVGFVQEKTSNSPTYKPGRSKRADWSSFEQKI